MTLSGDARDSVDVARAVESLLGERLVDRVVLREIEFPLEPPLWLAGRAIRARRYIVLELTLDDGATGSAYALTRGGPLFEAVRVAADELTSSHQSAALALLASGATPLAERVRSLVDICAWDLIGQIAGEPVWRLLATTASPQPALVVAGYRRPGETDLDIAERLRGLAARGMSVFKLPSEADPEATRRLVDTIRSVCGPQVELIIDLESELSSVEAAVAMDAAVRGARPLWLEDPFTPSAAAETRQAREGLMLKLAAGDEGSSADLTALLEAGAVDVLRADATTAGGVTGLTAIARTANRPMSYHVYPEVHRHLAMAFGAAGGIELFLPDDPFDAAARFIEADGLEIDRDGTIAPPTSAGLGMRVRADEVRTWVTRTAETRRGS